MDYATYEKHIEIDNHVFCVTINYCRNCGSIKSTTNVRLVKSKNGN